MTAARPKSDPRSKVGRQIRLPLSKAIEISFLNMRVRFSRTMITAGGVVLGIAFLMFVWTSQSILQELATRGPELVKASLAMPDEEAAAQRTWLVTLSLLVTAVGITNAMLMAVTERYREIGTMKCLGALDSFIVKMYLIESGFQGLVGSITGCLVGVLLATAITALRYGTAAFALFPLVTIARDGLIAMGIGIVLSVLSAIYPAYVAAKMAPAMALRSEI